MKLLIVAGGGGHFAAALGVIEALPKEWEVLVVGRKYTFEADKTLSFEYQTAKKLCIPFVTLTTGRLQRRFTSQSLVSLAKVPVGFIQAVRLLKTYKPDVVLSFGGYVSVPVGLAAKTLRLPIIVHEQILGAGLANKIVGKFAKKICVSWKESEKFFPKDKVVLTGNPIRRSGDEQKRGLQNPDSGRASLARMTEDKIAALLSVARNDDKKIIYVTGGSGGAHAINVLVEECLEQLLEKYIVIHQTGDAKEFGDFERLERKKTSLSSSLQKRYLPIKFIDAADVFSVLEKADLVISRSGINTVTELLSCGKPALFIPLPYGQHNEQQTNAEFVKQIGVAEIAEQQTLTAEKLAQTVDTMIENLDSYKRNGKKAQEVIIPDAAQKIIALLTPYGNQ